MSDVRNLLGGAQSPYLLQHAENPVAWMPWGEAAFERARAEDKPVFLSVGYSTCHWCHVMAHESFENAETAAILNAHFIPVKVDREERPDVDRLYMAFVQATTGSGGWPMSVWLTPDLKPFYGGTYYPPEDRYGRVGFPSVLEQLAEAWRTRRAEIEAQSVKMLAVLEESARPGVAGSAGTLDTAVARCFDWYARNHDATHGGFGGAPKFPRPVGLDFLFRYSVRRESPEAERKRAVEMALHTLRTMADGGMQDHLGGGFHRYSVDETWHVPHFEKMLYDQAQLACSYLEGYQVSGEERHAETARGILEYVLRDMTAPEGGFYSAEDADSLLEHGSSAHAEGAFYVWTKREVEELLGTEDAALFCKAYRVEAGGNAPEGSDPHGEFTGKNILVRWFTDAELAESFGRPEAEIAELFAAAGERLMKARAKRPRPHLDDKVLAGWNGLMISAFAAGAMVTGEERYLQAARRAAGFLLEQMRAEESGKLLRSWRAGSPGVNGFCADYAFVICGLLDLYQADGDTRWLVEAKELQVIQDALFGNEARGYFDSEAGDASILVRMVEDYDGAEPSANSVSAGNLLRLGVYFPGSGFGEAAEKLALAFADGLARSGVSMPGMLAAWMGIRAGVTEMAVTGGPGRADLLAAAHSVFAPWKVFLHCDTRLRRDFLAADLPHLKTLEPEGNRAAISVCRDGVCRMPVHHAEDVGNLL